MIHVVLLLGSESWYMLDAVTKVVERTHVVFLRQITGKRVR